MHFRIEHSRHAVNLIICSHQRLCPMLFDHLTKRFQIILPFISWRNGRRLPNTPFLHIIGIKMFQGCRRKQILIILSLQPLDIGSCHFSGQQRILSICFFRTTPTWVALHIDRRCPHTKNTFVFSGIQSSHLCSDNFSCFSDQLFIKRSTHANRILKNRCEIRLMNIKFLIMTRLHAMCSFSTYLKGRNAQPFDLGIAGSHTLYLFLQGHL